MHMYIYKFIYKYIYIDIYVYVFIHECPDVCQVVSKCVSVFIDSFLYISMYCTRMNCLPFLQLSRSLSVCFPYCYGCYSFTCDIIIRITIAVSVITIITNPIIITKESFS
jgi:hypothetical protein